MKHLSTISQDFAKHALSKEARKWDDLTYDEQRAYLKRHPKSKRRVTAKPGRQRTEAPSEDAKEPKTAPVTETTAIDNIDENKYPFMKYYTRESTRKKALEALAAADEAITSGTAYEDDVRGLSKVIGNDKNLRLSGVLYQLASKKKMSKDEINALKDKLGMSDRIGMPDGVKRVSRYIMHHSDIVEASDNLNYNIANAKLSDDEKEIASTVAQVAEDYKPMLKLFDDVRVMKKERGYRPKELQPVEIDADQPLEERYPFVNIVADRLNDIKAKGDQKSTDAYQRRNDRLLAALEVADESLQEGMIYNVDYKELKERINSTLPNVDFYKLVDKHGGNKEEVRDQIGWNDVPGFYGLNEIPKAIRQANSLAGGSGPVSAAAKEYVSKVEPFIAARDLLKQLKPMIVKGRKPNPNAEGRESYSPPYTAMEDIEKVKTLLTDMTNHIRERVVDNAKERYKDTLDTYMNETHGEVTPYDYGREKRDDYAYQILSRLTQSRFKPGTPGTKYAPIDDAQSKIDQMANDVGHAVLSRFIDKNTSKLSSIVGQKGGLKDATSLGIYSESGDVSGKMRFKFNDGSQFDAWSNVVLSWSSGGRLTSGTPFYRYPTTFHDIVMTDGSRKKAETEEWMNETFAQGKSFTKKKRNR